MYVLRWFQVLSTLASVGVLCSCGQTDFGGDIRVPTDRQHVLTAETSSRSAVRLPDDQLFNIHIKRSSQTPGADGQARGASDATGAGESHCLAEAVNGGSATADFKIGHQVRNDSGLAQRVDIDTTFEWAQLIEASTGAGADTRGSATLLLMVLDSKKKTVAQMKVVEATSDQALARVSSKDQRSLVVQIEPRRSYDIILVGQVDVAAAPDQEIRARLDVKGLQMSLTFAPGSARPTAE